MPDPSGWRGNTLNTSFATPKKVETKTVTYGGYGGIPAVTVQVPTRQISAVPGGYGAVAYGTVGQSRGNGVTAGPVNNTPSVFTTTAGRNAAQQLSGMLPSAPVGVNIGGYGVQAGNPTAGRGGAGYVSFTGNSNTMTAPQIGATAQKDTTRHPGYQPIANGPTPKQFTDRVPDNQQIDSYQAPRMYQPVAGNTAPGQTVTGDIAYNRSVMPGMPSMTRDALEQNGVLRRMSNGERQNYPMIPIAGIPGGMGMQSFGKAYGSADQYANALGQPLASLLGPTGSHESFIQAASDINNDPSIISGPETMPDPPEPGLLGGGGGLYAGNERPEQTLPQRGAEYISNGMGRIAAGIGKPLNAIDTWLASRVPGMSNPDIGRDYSMGPDGNYTGGRDTDRGAMDRVLIGNMNGRDQQAFTDLPSKDQAAILPYLRQGMSYAEAIKAAGIKTRTAGNGSGSNGSPRQTADWYYPRYTQNWAGLPRGKGNV